MNSSPLLSKPTFVPRFNATFHPEYEAAVVERTREYFSLRWPWASERQKEIYLQQDTEILGLLVCPDAPEDRAELSAAFDWVSFAYDDVLETVAYDKAVKAVKGMKRVLLDDHPPEGPFGNIFHDLRSRMLAIGDERTRELANNIFTTTATWLDKVIDRAERGKISEHVLDSYLKYRYVDCGFLPGMAMHGWELDISPPPDHLQRDPDFDKLFSQAAYQMILINDMYSYRKEVLGLGGKGQKLVMVGEVGDLQDGQKSDVFNAITILLREDGVDETNVMDKLGEHICKNESDFMSTVERLRVQYRDRAADLDVLQTWVEILIQWMGGNYYWSTTCRRYNQLA